MRGYSYAILWYSSILLGFYFLYAPLLPLLLLNRFDHTSEYFILISRCCRKWFRKCTDTLYATWEAFNVSLLELVFGVELILTGDPILPQENALLVLNHPTRSVLYHELAFWVNRPFALSFFLQNKEILYDMYSDGHIIECQHTVLH